jgi:hypothetical protein
MGGASRAVLHSLRKKHVVSRRGDDQMPLEPAVLKLVVGMMAGLDLVVRITRRQRGGQP